MESQYLVLGRVVKAHGLRGEVKLLLLAESWAPFASLDFLWLARPGAAAKRFALQAARGQGTAVLLKLGGVESPETAAGLVGCEAGVPRGEAPSAPDGRFYHYDILGLAVVHRGEPLGTVTEILETPAHDIYVVQGPRGEWLLPATRVHIRGIDLAARRIEVNPDTDVPGLLGGGEEIR